MKEYQKTVQELYKEYKSDIEKGLTDQQVAENALQYGINALTKPPRKSLLMRMIEALKEPMIVILIVAALITLGVNLIKLFGGEHTEFAESVGIFIAILLSVMITILMEGRSERAFEALNRISEHVTVKVIRNGRLLLIPQKEVVVGDIVRIETGDKITIDGRLFEADSLSIDESALTGESMPVKKDAQKIFKDGKVPLAERVNMVYSGCYVTAGKGAMLVTAVGDSTEFGIIAKELTQVESKHTPLQEKLKSLGQRITLLGSIAAAVIFLIQLIQLFLRGQIDFANIGQVFITSIVLIVAAVPEGLPTIVAVSLALNVIKMAKQKALVKKMIACETIGAINVICSDKTGTLTENKMTVTEIWTLEGKLQDNIIKNNDIINNFAVNSTANIRQKEDKTYEFIGSPTECALLVALDKSGLDYDSLRKETIVRHIYPFSSEQKRMTTVLESKQGNIAYAKGSPEKIVDMCAMEADFKSQMIKQMEAFQMQAKRVIAFAHKENITNLDFENNRADVENNMIFDGFVVITDPIRRDVFDAVKRCRDAGIQVKMLTGDNIVTASAIAAELGIVQGENQVFHAEDIENMSDQELYDRLDEICVIARSTPSTKLRVVNMLKKKGNVVAVTGDGVNDAPAIKNADVGIAMGITGTEVSKEASDIVLLDDSFTTIVKAVHWGRGIYENFQRFIQFQLAVNLSAVIVVIVSVLMGRESPFSALELLWINIIMDGPPALILGLEPIRDEMMKRKPIKRDASIITRDMLWRITVSGIYITVIFLWQTFGNFMGGTNEQASTILFTLFVIFQLFNAFNARELGSRSIFQNITGNKMMMLIFLLTFGLQVMITQYGGAVFQTVPLSLDMWLKITAVAFTVILISELYKLITKHIVK